MNDKEEKTFADYMIGDPKYTIWDRIGWKWNKVKDFAYETKWFIQRLFRSYHASDCNLWGLGHHLAKVILGKLKAFRALPLHGCPMCFSEYDEHGWRSKEEYDEAIAKGEMSGGSDEAWLKTLDEMIFAFEFICYYDEGSEKDLAKFLKKYNLKYPHEEIPENRKVNYIYSFNNVDGKRNIMSSHLPPDDPENKENRIYLGEDVHYYNFELEGEYWDRVQKGLQLFAKHFMSLWD